MASPPVDTHEWVSFEDEGEERTWVFDVTFLLSNWKCIFGEGCQGVLTGPAPELVQGCCSYGAHLIDKKDARRVEKVAKTLTAEDWENHGSKKPVIQTNKHGEMVTRIKGDACVFLNSPGFAAGAGCALHLAALKRGVNPLKYKPEVCWQLPLRREDQVEDDGHVISTIRQWDRRHWGKGGQEFHWWCTEGPEAFVGTKPVYQEMQAELTEMVGATVFEQFRAYIEQRERLRAQRVPLPHPAVRNRTAIDSETANPAPQLADLASQSANLASQSSDALAETDASQHGDAHAATDATQHGAEADTDAQPNTDAQANTASEANTDSQPATDALAQLGSDQRASSPEQYLPE